MGSTPKRVDGGGRGALPGPSRRCAEPGATSGTSSGTTLSEERFMESSGKFQARRDRLHRNVHWAQARRRLHSQELAPTRRNGRQRWHRQRSVRFALWPSGAVDQAQTGSLGPACRDMQSDTGRRRRWGDRGLGQADVGKTTRRSHAITALTRPTTRPMRYFTSSWPTQMRLLPWPTHCVTTPRIRAKSPTHCATWRSVTKRWPWTEKHLPSAQGPARGRERCVTPRALPLTAGT